MDWGIGNMESASLYFENSQRSWRSEFSKVCAILWTKATVTCMCLGRRRAVAISGHTRREQSPPSNTVGYIAPSKTKGPAVVSHISSAEWHYPRTKCLWCRIHYYIGFWIPAEHLEVWENCGARQATCPRYCVKPAWTVWLRLGCHHFLPHHQHGGASGKKTPAQAWSAYLKPHPCVPGNCSSTGAELTLSETDDLFSGPAQPWVPDTNRQLSCSCVCQSVALFSFLFVFPFLSISCLFSSFLSTIFFFFLWNQALSFWFDFWSILINIYILSFLYFSALFVCLFSQAFLLYFFTVFLYLLLSFPFFLSGLSLIASLILCLVLFSDLSFFSLYGIRSPALSSF